MRKTSAPANRRRAAVVLFFIMVALPLIWVAGALSVDYARVRMAKSEAQQIVNAAANAAAPIAAQNTVVLEGIEFGEKQDIQAADVARELIQTACDAGAAVKSSRMDSCDDVAESAIVDVEGTTVSVSIEYRIDGLIFLDILDSFLDFESEVSGEPRQYTAVVEATSSACTPEQDQSGCFRPAR